MLKWRNLGLVVMSAGLMAVVGCSSDDNGGPSGPTNTPTETRTTTATGTVTQTRTPAPPTDTPTEAPPTNTATVAPPSSTPTATEMGVETATPTETSEATETPTEGMEETPTPTPTGGGGEGLGDKVIDIFREMNCTTIPDNSCLFSSALFGLDVTQTPWVGGPIVLTAGTPDGDGIAPVVLKEDTVFGFRVVDNSAVCVKLVAEESMGQIDCDGGSPNDVSLLTDSDGSGKGNGTTTLETGVGEDGGPGALTLVVRILGSLLPSPADPSTCPDSAFTDFDITSAFTTNNATARIINTKQGAEALIMKDAGSAFDCATWSSGGAAGRMVAPLNVEEQPPINTDVANILQIQQDTAQ